MTLHFSVNGETLKSAYCKCLFIVSDNVVLMFSALRKENADYKQYIDGLVARVMIHCPEALAAGPDLKPLP